MFGRRTLDRLDRMLDEAISGTFEESDYDESKLSKLESKWKRFLEASALSRENLGRINPLIISDTFPSIFIRRTICSASLTLIKIRVIKRLKKSLRKSLKPMKYYLTSKNVRAMTNLGMLVWAALAPPVVIPSRMAVSTLTVRISISILVAEAV